MSKLDYFKTVIWCKGIDGHLKKPSNREFFDLLLKAGFQPTLYDLEVFRCVIEESGESESEWPNFYKLYWCEKDKEEWPDVIGE